MPSTRLPDLLPPLPQEVQIEPVGQCNLRCVMCLIRFRRDGPPFGQPAFMPLGLFIRLIDRFSPTASLHLQGLGEPLLHPQFFEMVSYAVNRGMRVTTNSNLVLLDSWEKAEACVRSGLSWMRISIDGATPGTYESIRNGSRLGKVLENIELLREAKARLRSPTPRLFLVMVAMNRNIHELAGIIRLAHVHGMEQVFVQQLCTDAADTDPAETDPLMAGFMEKESLARRDPAWLEEQFAQAQALARDLGIGLRLPAVRRTKRTGRPQGCDWPWRSSYITYDGKAMPCCMIALPQRFNFGDVKRRNILPIWHGERYQHFRKQLASGDPPDVCRTCSVYHGSF